MKPLLSDLLNLLKIHSPSGYEMGVVSHLTNSLKQMGLKPRLDSYGNLYAELSLGTKPFTVLLNSHMDTVATVKPQPIFDHKRQIVYTKSKSALGGDDKCGLATHLDVLRYLLSGQSKYTGTVKVLFTREEEIGCIGAARAYALRPEWFSDIDCSIVVDRRGSDHIITGGWSEHFCSEEYTQFWQDMAKITRFTGKPQEGTVSDTMIWAENGINSVNLSAAYYNAHTAQEYIRVQELYRISRWVKNAFDHILDYSPFPAFTYELERNWRNKYDFTSWHELTGTHPEWDFCDYCNTEYDVNELHTVYGKYKICNGCIHSIMGEEEI